MISPRIKKIFSILVMMGTLLLVGCATRDEAGVEKMMVDYWEGVFNGKACRAYSMLSWGSKRNTSFEEYADLVFWGPERTPQKDSLWALYGLKSTVQIHKIKIEGDTAIVDVVLTFPDINERIRTFSPQADSLFTSVDSLERKQWLIGKVLTSLEEGKIRPFILHMKLRVCWEFFSWRLIYE